MHGPISDSDNLLLRAWRRGELDDATRHAFETRLFLEPTLLEAAQIDQAFDAGIQHTLPRAANESPAPRLRQRSWPALAAAAAVGALAVLPFLFLMQPAEELRGNVEWVNVDVRRSTAAEPLLVQPRPATGVVALEVPAPAGVAGPYRARLRGIDGNPAVLDVTDLHPADGVLSLAFSRNALPAGVYAIEISGEAGDSAPAAPLRFRYRPD
jgi:hypothetical protein